jgi:hypothetical protein
VNAVAARGARAVESGLERLYHRRHPGAAARALLRLLRPLVVRCAPNDKWNVHVFVPEWLAALRVPPRPPLPVPKRIFLFCAYRIEFTLNLNLAILLAWRGHRVTIGFLPKLQSPIKEPRRDHPSAKPYLAAALSPVETLSGGRIRCVDLSDEPAWRGALDEEFIERQVLADLVMAIRRETLDEGDAEVRDDHAYYETLARTAQRVAWAHLTSRRDDYDLCLIPNGSTFEGAQLCHVAKRLGIPVNTFEKFAFRFVRILNHGDNFLAFDDLDRAWNLRGAAGYETEPFYGRACGRAMRLLDERRGNSTRSWGWSLQTAPPQTAGATLVAHGLEEDASFVLVCPNVPYDAGYEGLRTIFPSMRDWLVETVRFLLERSKATVIVRAHPAEAAHWGGRERSEDTLRAARLQSERLVVMPAETRVNTYALMEACRFGVVFSSTTGLEMSMLGRPVLVGTHAYYTRRGFTVDATDRDDYFAQLGRLCDEGEPTLSPEATRQAQLFHFILHCVMQWPYPYDKPSSIHALPPADLLASADVARYLDTLDVLTLTRDEWRERALGYLTATRPSHITEHLAR